MVHPPVRAQNAAFAVEYGPGHVTSHALKELILKHRMLIVYLRASPMIPMKCDFISKQPIYQHVIIKHLVS
jgi:hypothetical protein